MYEHAKTKQREALTADIDNALVELGMTRGSIRAFPVDGSSYSQDRKSARSYRMEVIGDQDVATGLVIQVLVFMSKNSKVILPSVKHISIRTMTAPGSGTDVNVFTKKSVAKVVAFENVSLKGSQTINAIHMDVADTVKAAWRESFDLPRCILCGAVKLISKGGKQYCSDICWENKDRRVTGAWRLKLKEAPFGTSLGDWEPVKPVSAWREEFKAISMSVQSEFGLTAAEFKAAVRLRLRLTETDPLIPPEKWVATALLVQSDKRVERYEKKRRLALLKPPTEKEILSVVRTLFDD